MDTVGCSGVIYYVVSSASQLQCMVNKLDNITLIIVIATNKLDNITFTHGLIIAKAINHSGRESP